LGIPRSKYSKKLDSKVSIKIHSTVLKIFGANEGGRKIDDSSNGWGLHTVLITTPTERVQLFWNAARLGLVTSVLSPDVTMVHVTQGCRLVTCRK